MLLEEPACVVNERKQVFLLPLFKNLNHGKSRITGRTTD